MRIAVRGYARILPFWLCFWIPGMSQSGSIAQNNKLVLDPTFSDSGTLQIRQGRREVGREVFRIRWEQDKLVAEADITLKHAQGPPISLHSRLAVDGQANLVSYTAENTGPGPKNLLQVFLQGSVAICEKRTETASESTPVIVDSGFLLLDTNVFHHYAVLGQRLLGPNVTDLPVLIPQEGVAGVLKIRSAGSDTITFAEKRVPVTHYKLDSGQLEISVWFDSQGRLYRIRVPQSNAEVLRIE